MEFTVNCKGKNVPGIMRSLRDKINIRLDMSDIDGSIYSGDISSDTSLTSFSFDKVARIVKGALKGDNSSCKAEI